jgi:hypothetical protein
MAMTKMQMKYRNQLIADGRPQSEAIQMALDTTPCSRCGCINTCVSDVTPSKGYCEDCDDYFEVTAERSTKATV